MNWDANVFRQPESVSDPQPGISGRSDRFSATTVGLRFDKTYSQQRLQINLSRSALHYDKFTSLDNDVYANRAAWLWQLSPRVSGTLSADRNRTETDFAETTGLRRISRRTTNRAFTADASLSGSWHLLMGISRTESLNSEIFLAQPSYRQDTGEFGFRYILPSRSMVGFMVRLGQGDNTDQSIDTVNFTDSEFTTRESELSAMWIAGVSSTWNGRLTWVERRNPNVPQRDLTGRAGELRYAWMATSALGLNLSASRSLTPYAFGLDASYTRDDVFAFAPRWQVTEKMSLSMTVMRRSSDFLGSVVSPAAPPRRDQYRSLECGIAWLPYRRVTLGATLRGERRTSTDARLHFDNTTASISAGLEF